MRGQGQGNGIERAKQRICLREFNASVLVTSLSQGFRVWTCSLACSFYLFLSLLPSSSSPISRLEPSLMERAIDASKSKGFPLPFTISWYSKFAKARANGGSPGGSRIEDVESRSTSPRFPRRKKCLISKFPSNRNDYKANIWTFALGRGRETGVK